MARGTCRRSDGGRLYGRLVVPQIDMLQNRSFSNMFVTVFQTYVVFVFLPTDRKGCEVVERGKAVGLSA